MSARRIAEVTRVLECYPELAIAGIEFRRIAEACCKRIPAVGIANDLPVVDVVEAAAEATIAALVGSNAPRGRNVANYLVAVFRRIASGEDDIAKVDTLSRVGVRMEQAEIERTIAECDRRRATDANRLPPDPELPRRALARMRPRPDGDGWSSTGPIRRPLPAREPALEGEACAPIGQLIKRDELEEGRDLAHAVEAWRGGP